MKPLPVLWLLLNMLAIVCILAMAVCLCDGHFIMAAVAFALAFCIYMLPWSSIDGCIYSMFRKAMGSSGIRGEEMANAMKMLREFNEAALSARDNSFRCGQGDVTILGKPVYVYLQQIIEALRSDDLLIERAVRDAICGYQESYPQAPNDECERELVERAEKANKWLVDHGFEPEKFTWSKEETPCL